MGSPKITHYPRDKTTTLCGRPITIMMKMTTDVTRITCTSCHGSPQLDGQLGNMTHTGH